MTKVIMFDKPNEKRIKEGIVKILQPHFKFLITKDAKSVWSGGYLVGFNEFDKSVFDKKSEE